MSETTTAEPVVVPFPPPQPRKKIAIFGTTPTRMEGPHQDNTGWDRWTIGPGGIDAHGWERLYEIHKTHPPDFKEYLDKLAAYEAPREIWTLKPFPHFKSNKLLPANELVNKYGRTWFSSSISWCMAHALEEGATDIGLFGIDLESGEEYISQFIGCRFFIDLARIGGVNIHLPPGCGLMREPTVYPDRYEHHLALTLERKLKWLELQVGRVEGEYDNQRAEMYRAEGRLLAMRGMGAPAEQAVEAEKVLIAANQRVGQLAANLNHLKGEQSATVYYRRMYCMGIHDPI